MMYFKNKKRFSHNLFTISRLADDESVDVLSDELMLSFIDYGSETPDNLNAFNHIDYGLVERESDSGNGIVKKYGLRLKDNNLSIANVFHEMVESLNLENVREEDKERFPQVTSEDFKAVLRMTTMILLAFERSYMELGEKDRVGISYREEQ
jgi:hypothetical protein